MKQPHRLPPCDKRNKRAECTVLFKQTTMNYERTIIMYQSKERCRACIEAERCPEGWA